jgi:hypothetical protein
MRSRRSNILITGLVILVAVAAFMGGMATGSAHASAQNQAPGPEHAQQIINTYLTILDTGMSTPQCDFSKMATIYAANARVTLSGGPFAPGGPFGQGNSYGAQEFDGAQAITGMYVKFCHVLYTKLGTGPQWTQSAAFLLAPNVLNSYEAVSANGHVIGRCMHVFTISGDRITSLDWAVYQ